MKDILILFLLLSSTAQASDVVENNLFCSNVINLIGIDTDNVITKLGAPLSITEENIKNSHNPDEIDKNIFLKYKNGEVLFRYVTNSDRHLLVNAKFSLNQSSNSFTSVIPSNINKLKEKYGRPDTTSDSMLKYYCTFEGNEWLEIYFSEKNINGFKFCGYFD